MFYKKLLQYKNIQLLSFVLIIAIMIFTSLFAISMLHINAKKIMSAMEQQNLSHQLLKQMIDVSDRRTSIIAEMLYTDDPFTNDEMFLELNTIGTVFTLARNKLLQLPHNHSYKPLILKQGTITKINAPLQLKVYELLQYGEKGKAISLYKNITRPQQIEIRKVLKKIQAMEVDLFNATFKKLKNDNKVLLFSILAFDLFGILFSILLTFLVIKKQRKSESKMAYLANTDTLTRLPNRTSFISALNEQIEVKQKKHFAVIFFDIDYFKSINDNYGHHVGDEVLKLFSAKIKKHISPNDILSRFGGDEFVLLLRSKTTVKEIVLFITSISQQMETSFFIENYEIFISSSIGVSIFPNDSKAPSGLLKNADIAMYSAKQSGKNCCRFFSKKTSNALEKEHNICHALQTTLKRSHIYNDLRLVYQPLYNIESNTVTECEALIRWKNKYGEIIPPSKFIPLAEKSNLIEKINLFVLDEACRQQNEWQKQGIHNIRININLSGNKQIFNKLLSRFSDNLKRFSLNVSLFGIELTERTLNEISQDTIDKLEKIRKKGMKISIDDFGTDYSSLIYLKRLPITTLKIDKEFIDDIPHNKNSNALVKTIINLAHSLDLDVVAEGVETSAQFGYLKENSCNIIQGYYLYRPLESEQFSQLKLVA